MKKLNLIVAVLISTIAFAQPEDFKKKKEKMDAMRIAFITEEVELTSEEAQVFWPIFNEMSEKEHALKKDIMESMMKYRKEGKDIDDIPEKELEVFMTKKLQNEKTLAQIKQDYHSKFIEVLGVRKTAKLYMSEMHFQRKLIQHTRGGHKEKGGPKGER